jgi:hypothetical protein
MKPIFDVEKATELRKHGKTYREISLEMGCSVAWCKKNLVNVEQGVNQNDPVKNEVKQQAVEILQKALKDIRAL